jgi:hypothetical protein
MDGDTNRLGAYAADKRLKYILADGRRVVAAWE